MSKRRQVTIDITRENFPRYHTALQSLFSAAAEDAGTFAGRSDLPPEATNAIGYSLVLDALKKLEVLRDDMAGKIGINGRLTHLVVEKDGSKTVERIERADDERGDATLN